MGKKISNKITPPHYEKIFERQYLLNLFEHKTAAPILWIVGPPGSGKTVFTLSLLKKRQSKFIWYRIDNNENNFEDIFYFLTMAACENYPWIQPKLPVFTSEYANNIEGFARVFFRQLSVVLTKESAIVLDNCQEIGKDDDFSRIVQIAANELPRYLQLICISRNQPGIGLKRLYVNNELIEVDNSILKFDTQESRAFIKWLNPQLKDHQARLIQIKNKGWVAGMVLMAEQFNRSKFTETLTTNNNVFEYLISEILSRISKEKHAFLVSTALFTQFTYEMAQALTGKKQEKSYLDALVHKNLFVERSVESTPSYSYHPLFRDLLLRQANHLFTNSDWQLLQRKAANILVKKNLFIEAMPLYSKNEDWESLAELLGQYAEQLIESGRSNTVRQWMKVLPDKYLKDDPWLCYWHAIAVMPVTPLMATDQLEKCYQQFIKDNDIKGIFSAWQAAVESITISLDDYSKLEIWMTRFDELRKKYPNCPTINLRIKFYSTAIQSLTVYNSQHPWLKGLLRIGENIMYYAPAKKIKIMLGIQLGHYYIFTCQLNKLQVIVHYLESALYEKTLPALLRIISAYLLVLQKLYITDTASAYEYAQKGLELSKLSGIPSFEGILHAKIISCHIHNGDLGCAKAAIHTAKRFTNVQQRILVALNYSYAAWLAVLDGNKDLAFEQNERALQLTKLIRSVPGLVYSMALKIQLLAESSQWEEAQLLLSMLSTKSEGCNNYYMLIHYYISDAWLAYLKQDNRRVLNTLKNLLQIMHTQQIFSFFGLRPDVLEPLCLLAIENDIYSEFAVCLLKRNRLFSNPAPYLEQWPWPVRIYTFGKLTIEIDGNPIEQSGKVQIKICELLVAIIALGGRNVNRNKLEEILWPDTEGDLARKSLETALHRLRKLIGKKAVIMNAGLISLNEKFCWVDLWAFEATLDELDEHLRGNISQQQDIITLLTNRLLALYRDDFLKNVGTNRFVMQQKRLLSRFLRIIDTTIEFHQSRGETERVSELLERRIELQPSVEANNQQLMQHYIALTNKL